MTSLLKVSAIIIILSFIFSLNSFAQKDFKELSTNDGVKVLYKWKPVKKSKKPALELAFMFQNTNDYCTDINFSFKINSDKEQKIKSDEYKKCIKAHKKLKGKKKGFSFLIEDATMEEANADKLKIDMDIEVKQAKKCK